MNKKFVYYREDLEFAQERVGFYRSIIEKSPKTKYKLSLQEAELQLEELEKRLGLIYE